VRRRGEDLESAFASVIEPYSAPGFENAVRATDILNTAKASAGIIKLIDSIHVVLFQAERAGDRMTFPASVPSDGEYEVIVGHYESYAYGTARLLIDGKPVGESLTGTGPDIRPAEPKALGTVRLASGEHELALELVAPDGEAGRYWMGITFVALEPAGGSTRDRAARPRIRTAERLRPSGPDGTLGLRIVRADGAVDYVFSAPDDAERTYDEDFVVAALFARVRTDAEGSVLQANVVGGARLNARGLSLRLEPAAWTARVVEVDEANREVVLDSALPEDGRLRGSAVYFSSPAYSRNTAYHVDRITVEDGRSRLRVREATFILGKAVIDGDPLDAETLASLVPHDYAKARGGTPPPEVDFFRGKLLRNADGTAETTIRNLVYGQPLKIGVDSVKGFRAGDESFYHDLRPGDRALIHAWATLTRVGENLYQLEANTAVRLLFAGRDGQVFYRIGGDEWHSAEDGLIPAEAVANATVDLRVD